MNRKNIINLFFATVIVLNLQFEVHPEKLPTFAQGTPSWLLLTLFQGLFLFGIYCVLEGIDMLLKKRIEKK